MPISNVFNEDCMEVMARYPDKYFDLAVVDPPYGGGCSQFVDVERERERATHRRSRGLGQQAKRAFRRAVCTLQYQRSGQGEHGQRSISRGVSLAM